MKNIEKFKKDLKLAIEIENKINEIETTKINSPVDELLNYAFQYGMIKTTMDVINLVKDFPTLENEISKKYDEYMDKKAKSIQASEKRRLEERARYGGTYDRYEDVPGYGTEWNMRCVPEGVYIRNSGRNSRC